MVKRLVASLLVFLSTHLSASESLNVAVTASFKPVVDSFAKDFFEVTNIRLNVSSASTGVLYQQVLAGAPFDVFFAADVDRPQQLAREMKLPDSARVTYAEGLLVLVTNLPSVQSVNDLALYDGRIVMANPQHAPYGVAAEQVLDAVGFSGERVLANNVSQARQYLSLGLADIGLIAASVAQGFETVVAIDGSRYDDILQQLVVIRPSNLTEALLAYLDSDTGQHALVQHGYLNPQDDH